MIERSEQRFGILPKRLIGDNAYGTALMLSWIVETKHIEPRMPVCERAERQDGGFTRCDFTWEAEADRDICPAGKPLLRYSHRLSKPRTGIPKHDILKSDKPNAIAKVVSTSRVAVPRHCCARSAAVFMSHRVLWYAP